MKNKNYEKLVEKYFPDKDPVLKEYVIFLLNKEILLLRHASKTNKTTLMKNGSRPPFVIIEDVTERFNKEDQFKEIRERFETLDDFIICFYENYLEIPLCPICKEKPLLKRASRYYEGTCGCKECVDALRKQTCLEIYGSECSLQNKDVQKKTIETNLKLYGTENASSSPIIRQKVIESNLKNYGVEYPQQLEEKKEKARQTNLERYGVEHAMQNEEIKKKSEITNRKNHGGFWNNQLESDKKKRVATYRKNRKEGKHKDRKDSSVKYYFNNEKFDSIEELAFYIYHTEVLKENVEREPIVIPYEVDGEEHDYYPDFRINGQLYEIKGSWGINWKREWVAGIWKYKKLEEIYKNRPSSEFMQALIEINKPYKAKYKKALENNVIIYTEKDSEIIKAINYCRAKFKRRKWYEQFRVKNNKKSKEDKA